MQYDLQHLLKMPQAEIYCLSTASVPGSSRRMR